jgi:hypothetical protein
MHATPRTLMTPLMVVAAAGLLAACASSNTLNAEVVSYGSWPTERKPGTYAFERLPSQQARADAQQRLEDAAQPALKAAGFVVAAPGTTPDVLVQLGARVTRYERSPWDDPLWWRGGFGYWRTRPWGGPYPPWAGPYPYGYRTEPSHYDREVALLLRDRANGTPLYEARASSEGITSGSDELLSAMFKAAMADFPQSGSIPHPVSVLLSP